MRQLPKFNYPEVREAARDLQKLGFEYVDMGARGHPLFEHPRYGKYSLALTPRDPGQWLKGFRGNVARQMGITRIDLERRLGIYQEKRKGPRRRSQRNEAGRRMRRFPVVPKTTPPPQRIGTVQGRMAEIAEEIGAATQGLKTAVGGDYDSLLDELSRLRSEYCQLEHDAKVTA
jgi:hypothetical protein